MQRKEQELAQGRQLGSYEESLSLAIILFLKELPGAHIALGYNTLLDLPVETFWWVIKSHGAFMKKQKKPSNRHR